MEIIGNTPRNDDGHIRAWELLQEGHGRDQSVIVANFPEILKLLVICDMKYAKIRDSYDQLTLNYEALKAMKGKSKVEGLDIKTLDKLVHIKTDLVRNNNNLEQ